MNYDIIVVGSGPGGYVAAIRASQLGKKVAIIERAELGGICLNWGCIPTKALLKSAQVFKYFNHADEFGLNIPSDISFEFPNVVKRSRGVAEKMSAGVQFLMKKNKIDVIFGTAKLEKGKKVTVTNDEGVKTYDAGAIIIATGARSRELPNLPQDGKKVIGYRGALALPEQPKKLVVVGSGAIGVEFAYFYHTLGTEVTIVEYLPRIVPVEDEDVSKQLANSFKKKGINVLTESEVTGVDTSGDGVKVHVKTKKGEEIIDADVVLSAVGVIANTENLGLDELGIKLEKNKIVVDDYMFTGIDGFYAIGDCILLGQDLAHVASAQGILCVEKLAGESVTPLDYGNVPGCTYCSPEIASVGLTEAKAKEAGYEVKVGKFPFTANGKAVANGATDGFVKVVFDAKYGEWLGCHMVGDGVTEMIAEAVAARKLETTAHEIMKAIHPHPTMSEAVMEAVEDAYGHSIHI